MTNDLLRLRSMSCIVKRVTEPRPMNPEQAQALGHFLRTRRHALGLSTRRLATLADVPDSTIVRFEQGAYAAPSADKLARLAQALQVPLADIYALAAYVVPSDLPSIGPYLRAKYRDLSPEALDALSRDVAQVFVRHGIDVTTAPLASDYQKQKAGRETKKVIRRKGGET